MEKNEKGALVEGFKLTPEQLAFQKKFQVLQRVGMALNSKAFQLKLESDQLRQMYTVLDEEAKGLVPPTESTFELPDMNFEEEQVPEGADFRLRY